MTQLIQFGQGSGNTFHGGCAQVYGCRGGGRKY